VNSARIFKPKREHIPQQNKNDQKQQKYFKFKTICVFAPVTVVNKAVFTHF
jgi:hypothetical protein